MKKFFKYSLSILTIITLAACSSSSGDSGQPTTAQATNAATQRTSTTSTNNRSVAAMLNKYRTNKAATTTVTNPTTSDYGKAVNSGKTTFSTITDKSNIPNKLVVDGQEIQLRYSGIYSGGFSIYRNSTINGVQTGTGAVSGYRYNAQFGYMNGVAFYQGDNPTATLPKGTATYIGDAVYASNGDFTTQSNGVELTVDFDKKTVNGTLFAKEDNINAVTVKNAAINGNNFSGTATQGSISANLEGKFYGSNADEVAGAYGGSQISGAFGAKKQ